jgi:hypothetical protein
MKPLSPDHPLALHSLYRRSPINRAIALYKNRAEICAPTCFAALLLACIPGANAANLGRLFFTPEQRTQLDYSHARNAPVEGNASPFFTVNGIVQKQGGARTVWVNGVSQNADHTGDRTPSAQTVTLPGKAQAVRLKVGDKILLDQPVQTPQAAPAE